MSIPAVAVVGAGSFGRHHLRVYAELAAAGHCRLAAAVDPSATVRAAATATYGIPAFATVEDLLAAVAPPHAAEAHPHAAGLQLTAASVCVPTVHHAEVASRLLHAGIDVLVEKPIAATLAEADALYALADSLGRILAVGHLERFNPAVTAAFAIRHQPMFFEAHRLSVFTPRSLDVDVVLDLMIHDLDLVLAFAQSPVADVRAVGLPVLSRRTDIANVRIEFRSGAVANFTASRVSTEQVRKLRFFQPGEYISVDFARQELLRIQVDREALAAALSGSHLPPSPPASPPHPTSPVAATVHPPSLTAHPTAGLALAKLPTDRAEPLRLELGDFLHASAHRTPPRVPGHAGREALALALTINEAIAAHAAKAGL